MTDNDQKTLPGLPMPDHSDMRAASPIPHSRSLFPLPAAQAIASSFSDALIVCGPSFSGGELDKRALSVLRFVAVNLDVICADDVYMIRQLAMLRDRLDAFLEG